MTHSFTTKGFKGIFAGFPGSGRGTAVRGTADPVLDALQSGGAAGGGLGPSVFQAPEPTDERWDRLLQEAGYTHARGRRGMLDDLKKRGGKGEQLLQQWINESPEVRQRTMQQYIDKTDTRTGGDGRERGPGPTNGVLTQNLRPIQAQQYLPHPGMISTLIGSILT